MIRKLLICALVMTLASVANAQVVWTYSGGSTTDATIWEDATNWTAPSGNTYTTPSEQYVYSETEGDRSFINDDVTQLVITGYTVNKTQITGLANQDDLYMGGNNVALTLDNATLTIGDDIKTGRDDMTSAANTSISLVNGSTLNCDEFYTAYASSSVCTTSILSGSTMNIRRVRAGYGGSETITIDGVGSTLNAGEYFRLGYSGYSSGNTITSTLSMSNGAQLITGTSSTGVRIAEGAYSKVNMTVTGTAANPCTIDTSLDEEDHAIGVFEIAGGDYSVSNVTIEHCTITTDTVSVGADEGSIGTLTLNSGTTLSAGNPNARDGEDLYVGDNDGTGIMTINSGASVYVADDVYLADNSASHGTLTVNAGGSIDCDSSLKLADDGTGIMNVYGTVDFSSDSSVGINGTSSGTLNIFDGANVYIGGILKTNDSTDVASSGEIVMTGGDLDVDEALVLGYKGGTGSTGIFTLSGGTVDIECNTDIDDYSGLILGNRSTNADATVNIDGGTMTVAGAIYMGSLVDPENTSGSDTGELRLNIDGGTLQAEDYVDAGTFSDHLITLTDGYLKLASANVSESEMLAMIGTDISCPNGYAIYTEGDYTVLTTPIPEPATIVMVLFGVAGLALIRRKK